MFYAFVSVLLYILSTQYIPLNLFDTLTLIYLIYLNAETTIIKGNFYSK